jgi:hypothetical protein
MSIHSIYRVSIWLPIIIPAVLLGAAKALSLPLADIGIVLEILVGSLVIGGVPYLALALWATWWVGGRPEPEIRRVMFRAPLLMVALFAPAALVVGLVVGALKPFIVVAVLGSVVIIPLGYAYVALAVWLRDWLGPQEA